MLKRFWVEMLNLLSIPELIDAVSLESDDDIDLDLLLIFIGCRTYSLAFLLAVDHASYLIASVLWFELSRLGEGELREWHGAALLLVWMHFVEVPTL